MPRTCIFIKLSTANRLVALFVLGCALALEGCSGALRSRSIDQLATIEASKLKTLHDDLLNKKDAVNKAIDDLKSSYHNQLDAREIWERQVLDAKLVAAVPGRLDDPVIKRAVYVELANLHLDQSDLFAAERMGFDARADALKAAYTNLIDGLAQSQKDFGPVADYAGASNVEFAVSSVDVATIGAAVGEFQEAQKVLAQAQRVAARAQPGIAAGSKTTTNISIQNFLSILSQISARLKEIPSK